MRLGATKSSATSSYNGLGNQLWDLGGARPSLDLNFAGNKNLFDSISTKNLITFTRASSGTYVGSDGLIKTATTNEPRFDHNPTTGESLGLLVEEQRTNLLLQSNSFTTTWSATDSTATANQISAPDGTGNGWKLVTGTGNANHNIFQSIGWGNGTWTVSLFAKYLDHRWIGVRIGASGNHFFGSWDLLNGVVGSATAGATIGMQNVGGGWYRLRLTATLTTSANANFIIGLNNADATSLTTYIGTGTGIYLFGAQLEAGAFPTSYIPTTIQLVTRSADVASIAGSNFSSWYNQTEGTVFVDAASIQNLGRYFMFADAAVSDRWEARYSSWMAQLTSWKAGVGDVLVNTNVAPSSPALNVKLAAANKSNDAAIASNGANNIVGTDNASSMPSAQTRLWIGSFAGTATYLNGTIRRLTYWPSRLPNATLQQITR